MTKNNESKIASTASANPKVAHPAPEVRFKDVANVEVNPTVEIVNEGPDPVFVAVCRTATLGKLYVHVAPKPDGHWTTEVKPHDYAHVEIQERRM